MIKLTKNELNTLIYEYMQQQGLYHAAFTFQSEILCEKGPLLYNLVDLVSKGMQYLYLETHFEQESGECEAEFTIHEPHFCTDVEKREFEKKLDDFVDKNIAHLQTNIENLVQKHAQKLSTQRFEDVFTCFFDKNDNSVNFCGDENKVNLECNVTENGTENKNEQEFENKICLTNEHEKTKELQNICLEEDQKQTDTAKYFENFESKKTEARSCKNENQKIETENAVVKIKCNPNTFEDQIRSKQKLNPSDFVDIKHFKKSDFAGKTGEKLRDENFPENRKNSLNRPKVDTETSKDSLKRKEIEENKSNVDKMNDVLDDQKIVEHKLDIRHEESSFSGQKKEFFTIDTKKHDKSKYLVHKENIPSNIHQTSDQDVKCRQFTSESCLKIDQMASKRYQQSGKMAFDYRNAHKSSKTGILNPIEPNKCTNSSVSTVEYFSNKNKGFECQKLDVAPKDKQLNTHSISAGFCSPNTIQNPQDSLSNKNNIHVTYEFVTNQKENISANTNQELYNEDIIKKHNMKVNRTSIIDLENFENKRINNQENQKNSDLHKYENNKSLDRHINSFPTVLNYDTPNSSIFYNRRFSEKDTYDPMTKKAPEEKKQATSDFCEESTNHQQLTENQNFGYEEGSMKNHNDSKQIYDYNPPESHLYTFKKFFECSYKHVDKTNVLLDTDFNQIDMSRKYRNESNMPPVYKFNHKKQPNTKTEKVGSSLHTKADHDNDKRQSIIKNKPIRKQQIQTTAEAQNISQSIFESEIPRKFTLFQKPTSALYSSEGFYHPKSDTEFKSNSKSLDTFHGEKSEFVHEQNKDVCHEKGYYNGVRKITHVDMYDSADVFEEYCNELHSISKNRNKNRSDTFEKSYLKSDEYYTDKECEYFKEKSHKKTPECYIKDKWADNKDYIVKNSPESVIIVYGDIVESKIPENKNTSSQDILTKNKDFLCKNTSGYINYNPNLSSAQKRYSMNNNALLYDEISRKSKCDDSKQIETKDAPYITHQNEYEIKKNFQTEKINMQSESEFHYGNVNNENQEKDLKCNRGFIHSDSNKLQFLSLTNCNKFHKPDQKILKNVDINENHINSFKNPPKGSLSQTNSSINNQNHILFVNNHFRRYSKRCFECPEFYSVPNNYIYKNKKVDVLKKSVKLKNNAKEFFKQNCHGTINSSSNALNKSCNFLKIEKGHNSYGLIDYKENKQTHPGKYQNELQKNDFSDITHKRARYYSNNFPYHSNNNKYFIENTHDTSFNEDYNFGFSIIRTNPQTYRSVQENTTDFYKHHNIPYGSSKNPRNRYTHVIQHERILNPESFYIVPNSINVDLKPENFKIIDTKTLQYNHEYKNKDRRNAIRFSKNNFKKISLNDQKKSLLFLKRKYGVLDDSIKSDCELNAGPDQNFSESLLLKDESIQDTEDIVIVSNKQDYVNEKIISNNYNHLDFKNRPQKQEFSEKSYQNLVSCEKSYQNMGSDEKYDKFTRRSYQNIDRFSEKSYQNGGYDEKSYPNMGSDEKYDKFTRRSYQNLDRFSEKSYQNRISDEKSYQNMDSNEKYDNFFEKDSNILLSDQKVGTRPSPQDNIAYDKIKKKKNGSRDDLNTICYKKASISNEKTNIKIIKNEHKSNITDKNKISLLKKEKNSQEINTNSSTKNESLLISIKKGVTNKNKHFDNQNMHKITVNAKHFSNKLFKISSRKEKGVLDIICDKNIVNVSVKSSSEREKNNTNRCGSVSLIYSQYYDFKRRMSVIELKKCFDTSKNVDKKPLDDNNKTTSPHRNDSSISSNLKSMQPVPFHNNHKALENKEKCNIEKSIKCDQNIDLKKNVPFDDFRSQNNEIVTSTDNIQSANSFQSKVYKNKKRFKHKKVNIYKKSRKKSIIAIRKKTKPKNQQFDNKITTQSTNISSTEALGDSLTTQNQKMVENDLNPKTKKDFQNFETKKTVQNIEKKKINPESGIVEIPTNSEIIFETKKTVQNMEKKKINAESGIVEGAMKKINSETGIIEIPTNSEIIKDFQDFETKKTVQNMEKKKIDQNSEIIKSDSGSKKNDKNTTITKGDQNLERKKDHFDLDELKSHPRQDKIKYGTNKATNTTDLRLQSIQKQNPEYLDDLKKTTSENNSLVLESFIHPEKNTNLASDSSKKKLNKTPTISGYDTYKKKGRNKRGNRRKIDSIDNQSYSVASFSSDSSSDIIHDGKMSLKKKKAKNIKKRIDKKLLEELKGIILENNPVYDPKNQEIKEKTHVDQDFVKPNHNKDDLSGICTMDTKNSVLGNNQSSMMKNSEIDTIKNLKSLKTSLDFHDSQIDVTSMIVNDLKQNISLRQSQKNVDDIIVSNFKEINHFQNTSEIYSHGFENNTDVRENVFKREYKVFCCDKNGLHLIKNQCVFIITKSYALNSNLQKKINKHIKAAKRRKAKRMKILLGENIKNDIKNKLLNFENDPYEKRVDFIQDNYKFTESSSNDKKTDSSLKNDICFVDKSIKNTQAPITKNKNINDSHQTGNSNNFDQDSKKIESSKGLQTDFEDKINHNSKKKRKINKKNPINNTEEKLDPKNKSSDREINENSYKNSGNLYFYHENILNYSKEDSNENFDAKNREKYFSKNNFTAKDSMEPKDSIERKDSTSLVQKKLNNNQKKNKKNGAKNFQKSNQNHNKSLESELLTKNDENKTIQNTKNTPVLHKDNNSEHFANRDCIIDNFQKNNFGDFHIENQGTKSGKTCKKLNRKPKIDLTPQSPPYINQNTSLHSTTQLKNDSVALNPTSLSKNSKNKTLDADIEKHSSDNKKNLRTKEKCSQKLEESKNSLTPSSDPSRFSEKISNSKESPIESSNIKNIYDPAFGKNHISETINLTNGHSSDTEILRTDENHVFCEVPDKIINKHNILTKNNKLSDIDNFFCQISDTNIFISSPTDTNKSTNSDFSKDSFEQRARYSAKNTISSETGSFTDDDDQSIFLNDSDILNSSFKYNDGLYKMINTNEYPLNEIENAQVCLWKNKTPMFGTKDGKLVLINNNGHRKEYTFTSEISTVDIDRNHNKIVVGTIDGSIYTSYTKNNIISFEKYKRSCTGPILSTKYNPYGTNSEILAVGYDGYASVISKTSSRFKISPEPITSCAWIRDNLFVTGTVDKKIAFCDMSNQKICSLEGHSGAINSLISKNGITASTACENNVFLWNFDLSKNATLKGHTDWVLTEEFLNNGDVLCTGGRDNFCLLWDLKTARKINTFQTNSNIYKLEAYDQNLVCASTNKNSLDFIDQRVGIIKKISTNGNVVDFSVSKSEPKICMCIYDQPPCILDMKKI